MKKLKKKLAILMTLAFVLTTAFASASIVFAEPGGEGDDGIIPVRLTYTIVWDDNNNADGLRPEEVVLTFDDHLNIFSGNYRFDEEIDVGEENTWTWTSDNTEHQFFIPSNEMLANANIELLDFLYNGYGRPFFHRGPNGFGSDPLGYWTSTMDARYKDGVVSYYLVFSRTEEQPPFGVAELPSKMVFDCDGYWHGPYNSNSKGYYFSLRTGGRFQAFDVGKYTATAKLLKGYRWSDGTTAPKTINWEIKEAVEEPIEVAVPTGKTLTYNGKAQTGVDSGVGYTLSETTTATNAGTYTATATLKEGYVWLDGKTEPKTITWKINKATVNVTAPTGKTFTYNGKTQTGVSAGSNYSLSGTVKATNAGSYTAKATLKSDANYTYKWSDGMTAAKTIKWTINKAGNPLTIKAKTATVKYSAVKKKAQTLAVGKVITFTKKGQGKMTYTKVSGNKKIVINKTTGKVTVKKGLKKGTYKVKVKIKATGNANYKASAWKTVTFKVKVK